MSDSEKELKTVNELKPCPMCGGNAKIMRAGTVFHAICENGECGVKMDFWRSKEAVAKAWNHRYHEKGISHYIEDDRSIGSIVGRRED
jgi:hypothetical protein